MSLMP